MFARGVYTTFASPIVPLHQSYTSGGCRRDVTNQAFFKFGIEVGGCARSPGRLLETVIGLLAFADFVSSRRTALSAEGRRIGAEVGIMLSAVEFVKEISERIEKSLHHQIISSTPPASSSPTAAESALLLGVVYQQTFPIGRDVERRPDSGQRGMK